MCNLALQRGSHGGEDALLADAVGRDDAQRLSCGGRLRRLLQRTHHVLDGLVLRREDVPACGGRAKAGS